MANLVINGATYEDVPSIEVPNEDGEMVNYVDNTTLTSLLSRLYVGNLTIRNCTILGDYSLYNCRFITSMTLPETTAIYEYAMNACRELATLDLPICTQIGTRGISYTDLSKLLLRNPIKVTLGNSNAIISTPIASGTGYIYVPSALVDSYKSATNWSVYANQFRALEDYTVDGTITGELDESKI